MSAGKSDVPISSALSFLIFGVATVTRQWDLCARANAATPAFKLDKALARMIHKLVGWDKETAIWWAGACELTFHFDYMLFWVR